MFHLLRILSCKVQVEFFLQIQLDLSFRPGSWFHQWDKNQNDDIRRELQTPLYLSDLHTELQMTETKVTYMEFERTEKVMKNLT